MTPLERQAAALRGFNRFYTRLIGVLDENLSASPFSLTAARVLYELATRPELTASELGAELGVDSGYLSRMFKDFEMRGLLTRAPSEADRRRQILRLTDAGQAAFAPLDAAARQEAIALLTRLPDPAREEVIAAMRRIEALLGGNRQAPCTLRPPQPGDIGWVIERHAALYWREYGFDHRFEALVARVAGDFLATHDPAWEQCWIAEQDGVRAGSVFLVRKDADTAKLRLLIVEPSARGLGIGRTLVQACIARARELGYRRMVLWTNDILLAARAIYQAEGFRLVASQPHSDFGPPMVGEDWALDL